MATLFPITFPDSTELLGTAHGAKLHHSTDVRNGPRTVGFFLKRWQDAQIRQALHVGLEVRDLVEHAEGFRSCLVNKMLSQVVGGLDSGCRSALKVFMPLAVFRCQKS